MKLAPTSIPTKKHPPDDRGVPAVPRRAGARPRPARAALAAGLIWGSAAAMNAALACGSDEAAVDDGSNPTANAGARATAGSGGSGSSNTSGAAKAGAANVAAAGSGGQNAAGASDAATDEFVFLGPDEACAEGLSSELCTWSLAPELTGATCTPGQQILLGCCDCGSNGASGTDDPILRVCDGDTPCSATDEIASVDDGCQYCPLVDFTCPESGVYSALVGSWPAFETDDDGSNPRQVAAGASACQPKLLDASDRAAAADAGTVRFDQVHPILVTQCGRCHAEETGLGMILGLPPFASPDIETAYDAAQFYSGAILGQISAGVMPVDTCAGPPGSPGCVSVEDYELIRKWFSAGSPP